MKEEQLRLKRERLKREIDVAQEYLSQNMSDMSLTKYLSFGTSIIPGILTGLIDKPGKAIAKGDMIARNVLPSSNIFRKIFKYLSLLARSFKLITKRDNPV